MKKKLDYYLAISQNLFNNGYGISAIGQKLKEEGASLAIMVISFKKIGFTFEIIDNFLRKDSFWKDEKINLIDLFIDYVELDDDLVNDQT